MPTSVGRTVLGIFVIAAALGQTGQDFCSSNAACYTPARGPNCPTVRFGWGNCPGSRQACDWCYGPNGVFAYTPRGSVYTLSSGCNQLGSNATWSTRDPQVAQWMSSAGGSCTPDGRGGTTCSNVDPGRFKQAANCGGSGNPSAPQQPAPSPSQGQPAQPSTSSSGTCSCYTPARGPNCPTVRFGWGDCPGSRQACDWCYGPNGVFAYTPRGSQYTLSSGCNQLGANAIWSTQDPQVAQAMQKAGGNCSADGRGGFRCSNVNPAQYQTANCGSPGCGVPAPGGGTSPTPPSSGADPIAGTLPPVHGIFDAGGASNCQQIKFTYFFINGINTPMGPIAPSPPGALPRGTYVWEHDSVAVNLVDDPSQVTSQIPVATGKVKIKVANETDYMYLATHNPSGKDPWKGTQWVQQNCLGNQPKGNAQLCGLLQWFDNYRAGNYTFHMAPGDLFECLMQSISLPGLPGIDIGGTAQDATVQQVVQAIENIYQQEQAGSNTKNYFIVVGHSQGNFFVEAVAYSLKNSGGIGAKIYQERLGLISLGSPTSYDMLTDSNFQQQKIVHHTRADDAINVLTPIHGILVLAGGSAKQPWVPNDPMLWPWPASTTWDWLFGLFRASSGSPAPSKMFNVCNAQALVCNPASTGTFFQRLGYNSGVARNPELYTPLMNSHLLDNYMDIPTATKPMMLLKFDPSVMPWEISPRTTTVLNCIRGDLLKLKKNLMTGSTDPVTTADCPVN